MENGIYLLALFSSLATSQNLTPHLLTCMKANDVLLEDVLRSCDDRGGGGPCCHWFYSYDSPMERRRSRSFETESRKPTLLDPPKFVDAVVTPNENGEMFINIQSHLNFNGAGNNMMKRKGQILEPSTTTTSPTIYTLRKSYLPYEQAKSKPGMNSLPDYPREALHSKNLNSNLLTDSSKPPFELNMMHSSTTSSRDSFMALTDDQFASRSKYDFEQEEGASSKLSRSKEYQQFISQKAKLNDLLKSNLGDNELVHRAGIEDPLRSVLEEHQGLNEIKAKRPLTKIHEEMKKSQVQKSQFSGGQRRGIVVPGAKDKKYYAKKNIDVGYSKEICMELKVPCRFVVDHPCCIYEMPLDLVARARSMDGSADLVWRSSSPLQTRARSLSGFLENKSPRTGRQITYDYATSRSSVRTPKYTFDGFGLEITSNLIGNCWRIMQNIDCSISKTHPCCLIAQKPSGPPTLDRVSRWINNIS